MSATVVDLDCSSSRIPAADLNVYSGKPASISRCSNTCKGFDRLCSSQFNILGITITDFGRYTRRANSDMSSKELDMDQSQPKKI